MSSSLHDPKLLYSIPGVSAYHIANGVEQSLTPAGPQTLSLLMVPTASVFADTSIEPASTTASGAAADGAATSGANTGSRGSSPEEDFYLHLHLPPELDLPLPATTQIYHQPPSSYLIPRWDLGRQSGVFTRIEFPPAGSRKGLQEDVDTFETILAQCTAFLERAPPPKIHRDVKDKNGPGSGGSAGSGSATNNFSRPVPPPPSMPPSFAAATRAGASSSSSSLAPGSYRDEKKRSSTRSSKTVVEELPAYNPAAFKPGEAYVAGSHSSVSGPLGGQIVLVDEEDGSVIGELGEGFQVIEDQNLKPGSKDPVEITLPTDDKPTISVRPAFLEEVENMHPAYKKSSLVSNALAASRLIVATSEIVSRTLQTQAGNYTRRSEPANKPITFKPTTHAHIRRINTISTSAVGLSSKAVGQVGKVAQNLGASLAGHKTRTVVSEDGKTRTRSSATGLGPDGEPLDNFKPGLLNKSLMAFSTVVDGIEQAGRHLLDSSSSAATTVATHKWGPEAGELARNLGGGIKNVGLVYIDVTGVSRRAVIKSVAKGMVVGHVPGGGDVIVHSDGQVGPASVAGASSVPSSRNSSPKRTGSGGLKKD